MNRFQSLCLESGIKYDYTDEAVSSALRKFLFDERVGFTTKEEFIHENVYCCIGEYSAIKGDSELLHLIEDRWEQYCITWANECVVDGSYNELMNIEIDNDTMSHDFDYNIESIGLQGGY